jgi:hypothetical protein
VSADGWVYGLVGVVLLLWAWGQINEIGGGRYGG